MTIKQWQAGINLGGWISQYPALDHKHFRSFITAKDIKRIADWGADHVRLPVDYPVLESDDAPGQYDERGFTYIDSCVRWCQENRLALILDLHKAPGYAFDALSESSLFEDPSLQERLVNLWAAIAARYAGMGSNLAFELLNEIVLPDSRPWNALIQRLVTRIRAVDPDRWIVIGGNHYNAPQELQHLDILDDPHILYTFHFYAPLAVTHQKAPWIPALVDYNCRIDYPGIATGLEQFLEEHPEHRGRLGGEANRVFDRTYLQTCLEPALLFRKRTGKPIYCGEFGVYEQAPMATRLNWTRDAVALFLEHGIGRAIWSYKALDFGLVDAGGRVVNEDLVRLSVQK